MKKEKILLIHGWSDAIYNHLKEKPTREKYFGQEFIQKLSEKFDVVFLDLPGFFDKKEPAEKEWFLENYSKYLKDFLDKNSDIKYILARSFGGAVAVKAKVDFDLKQKLILFAPAIVRKISNKNISAGKIKKIIPKFVLNSLRDFYLIYYVKNPFYIKGSNFLRNTYRNIVSVELVDEFQKIKPNDVLVFFGKNDTATPPELLLSKIQKNKDRVIVLDSGGHNFFTEENPSEKIKFCLSEIERFTKGE